MNRIFNSKFSIIAVSGSFEILLLFLSSEELQTQFENKKKSTKKSSNQ